MKASSRIEGGTIHTSQRSSSIENTFFAPHVGHSSKSGLGINESNIMRLRFNRGYKLVRDDMQTKLRDDYLLAEDIGNPVAVIQAFVVTGNVPIDSGRVPCGIE